jgi:hypothetical protein
VHRFGDTSGVAKGWRDGLIRMQLRSSIEAECDGLWDVSNRVSIGLLSVSVVHIVAVHWLVQINISQEVKLCRVSLNASLEFRLPVS